ncbi:hypothetical protein BS78_07G210800 [Paspalum vaginatum]|nr:hypothetical protein BS78_07G210800 [Paspalum vaginatum]
MVCLGFSFNGGGCQDAHPSALDYFLAVLVVVAAVVAARLLVSAVARCLCGDGAVAHHHHHHDSPVIVSDDVDEDVLDAWGGAIFGQLGEDAAEQAGGGGSHRRDGARVPPHRSPHSDASCDRVAV